MIAVDFLTCFLDANTTILDQPRDRDAERAAERDARRYDETTGKWMRRVKKKKKNPKRKIVPGKKLPSHCTKGADLTGIAPPPGAPERGDANPT